MIKAERERDRKRERALHCLVGMRLNSSFSLCCCFWVTAAGSKEAVLRPLCCQVAESPSSLALSCRPWPRGHRSTRDQLPQCYLQIAPRSDQEIVLCLVVTQLHRINFLKLPAMVAVETWSLLFFFFLSFLFFVVKACTEGKPGTIYDKRDEAAGRGARGKRLYKYPLCLILFFFFFFCLRALKYSENSQ